MTNGYLDGLKEKFSNAVTASAVRHILSTTDDLPLMIHHPISTICHQQFSISSSYFLLATTQYQPSTKNLLSTIIQYLPSKLYDPPFYNKIWQPSLVVENRWRLSCFARPSLRVNMIIIVMQREKAYLWKNEFKI